MPFSPLLALSFANPLMLYGLAAASLPIIIHLLNRRKFREMNWAAMRFLVAAIRKNSRRIKIEQWLLLAVRTLLVILIVLAMAKPFLEQLGAMPLLAGQRTHRVLVLDGSMSMAYAEAEVSRFDRAKALASQLVRQARQGDAISVVLMGEPPRVVIGDPSPNHAEVLREIEPITLPHGATDLTASFQAIERVLEASTIPQKEVIFLTDLQAASWQRPGTDDDGLKRALARLDARRVRSVVVDLGQSGGENRAITDVALNTPIVTVGSSVILRAVLHNYGPDPRRDIGVRMLIDGQMGPRQEVDLPVGEDTPVVFTYAFTAPGDHVIEIQIDEDPLELDNRRWLVVPVREYLRVLLVDGDPTSELFASETDYLAEALNPEADSPGSPSVIRTDVVAESDLMRRDLAEYDAVVLCNIAQFTTNEVAALDAYLRQGGGVVVFGGDQVIADNYNRLLFADGQSFLPAEVGPSVGSSQARESAFGFDPLGFRHPIVAMYDQQPDSIVAGLTNTKTWQFHRLRVPEESPAQVALAFDNGDPAIVEAPYHRGRVIQVATSANIEWTTWPVHLSYAPVMEQIMLQAASGRLAERNVQVGQPLEQALPPTGIEAPVTVVAPDGRPLTTKLQAGGDISVLNFEGTDLSGAYQVRIGPPLALETVFAANIDPIESNPAKLDRAGLAEALPGWNFAYLTNWQELTEDAGAVSRRGELHRHLLYGVLALLLIESVLAWKFGHHR